MGIPSNLGVEEVLALRAHEPWYDEAVTALYAEAATPQEMEHYRLLAAPLLYGRWDVSSQAQAAAEPAQFAQPATDGFYAGFDPDPALPERLAEVAAPVLLVAGEYDIWPTAASVRELALCLRQCRDSPFCRARGTSPGLTTRRPSWQPCGTS